MFLFGDGQSKEAAIQLENAMSVNPKLIKKFIQLDPRILKHRQVVEIIAKYKKRGNK
jgi:hypothetical protein